MLFYRLIFQSPKLTKQVHLGFFFFFCNTNQKKKHNLLRLTDSKFEAHAAEMKKRRKKRGKLGLRMTLGAKHSKINKWKRTRVSAKSNILQVQLEWKMFEKWIDFICGIHTYFRLCDVYDVFWRIFCDLCTFIDLLQEMFVDTTLVWAKHI